MLIRETHGYWHASFCGKLKVIETLKVPLRNLRKHSRPLNVTVRLRTVPEKLLEPLRWKKSRKIFVNSMSDLFHPGVPDEYIVQVAQGMMDGHWHQYQVLTKRSARLRTLTTNCRYFNSCRVPHSAEGRSEGAAGTTELLSSIRQTYFTKTAGQRTTSGVNADPFEIAN